MSGSPHPLHLAVALDGTGWHPASWREPGARPADLLTRGYWTDLVIAAERGLLDFVTIEDGPTLQSRHPRHPDDRTDQVRGRLDATLDYVSSERAGVRVQLSARQDAARHFGRRSVPEPAAVDDLFGEAADYVEVVRRLWDSWEDEAEIRDVATGRFIDRKKLHYIDFEGAHFSVKGPSITPRPPQGQPIVAALGHVDPAYALIASSTDVGFVTPHSSSETATLVDAIAARRNGRTPVRVFADIVVFLDDTPDAAIARRDRLDLAAGREYVSDAEIFVGTADSPRRAFSRRQQHHGVE